MYRVGLSPLELAPSSHVRRAMPRPPQFRPPGYEDEYDFDTVFYDCFSSPDGRQVFCICPPLLNLEPVVLPPLHTAFLSGGPSADAMVGRFDRLQQFRFPRTKDCIPMSGDVFRQGEIVVQPNHSHLFQGKKVLLSKSKDNDLIWIADWVRFHAANHDCNAVLLYDNASTTYQSHAIREALAAIPGIDVAVVVDWPFKFGPQGGPWNIWDSDYCQYAILEHARHRFLSLAAGVVSVDVDELVITQGGRSVYELLARSRTGYLLFPGIWIESATKAGNGMRRHLDYVYRSIRPTEGMGPKWAAISARCSPQSQWAVHRIIGMQNDDEAARSVSFRHFRAINTNWQLARWRPEQPNDRNHVIDEDLVRCFRVFDCHAR